MRLIISTFLLSTLLIGCTPKAFPANLFPSLNLGKPTSTKPNTDGTTYKYTFRGNFRDVVKVIERDLKNWGVQINTPVQIEDEMGFAVIRGTLDNKNLNIKIWEGEGPPEVGDIVILNEPPDPEWVTIEIEHYSLTDGVQRSAKGR